MKEIKCVCGEANCTTTIEVESSMRTVFVAIRHSNSTSNNLLDAELDANGVIDLIGNLKTALLELTDRAR